ncbi:PIG-L family deacetylase [Catellatospora sp. KI3]|uniref:PIG-L deacetylase family protein n=1 Tax=Catellatospora sp. KI3 TaxID=3041620 RepID=UPI002482CD93|nr:PIG-L deacetylase family protein [Catellatospora sp. KI3]MDI1464382.1 PIG-L family deacetylase [Catellatospora sp. KI3]
MSFPPSAPPLPDVSRVLCVFAHPDDVDFGSAGTVAAWVDAGIEVSYLLVTRGDAGGFDDTPRHEMPLLREAEQRAAAAAVGVETVEFLEGYRDGSVTASLELRRDLVAAIRRHRPDRILTSSPLRRWDRIAGPSHPDHLATGEAVTCAVYPDARNPFAHPELAAAGLAAWTVREIWYSGGPDPDHAVDVTGVFDRKLAALRAHASQTSHLPDLEGMLRERLGALATAHGLPGRVCEAFTVIRTE